MSFQFRWQGQVKDAADGLRRAEASLVPENSQRAAVTDFKAAAVKLVEDFAALLGDGYGEVSVNVSGHANVGHRPTFGWADDCLTVTVQAIARAPEP